MKGIVASAIADMLKVCVRGRINLKISSFYCVLQRAAGVVGANTALSLNH